MALRNHSTMTEFLLLGLPADHPSQALLFVFFLVIYLLTLSGNLLMILVIRANSHLHTPMYFFLSHLSFLDLCYSSVTVPKMLENLLSEKKTISVEDCLTQAFFVFDSGGTEICLLAAMAYDRYAAICHPLRYSQMMSDQLCVGLVWGSWGLAFLDALINTLLAWNLDLCETRVISNFLCEIPSLFPLSCSNSSNNFAVLLCSALLHAFGTFLLLFYSYVRIVSTILSISSTSGRSKAFSTCSSHLTSVTLFYASGILRYLMPTSGSPWEVVFSMQYSVVTPLVNPLVYSLKNKEVKAGLKNMLQKSVHLFWRLPCFLLGYREHIQDG
ncbi:olfactory receptor 8S1-like [Desmodus rotundus]|uniref:olfactory receptor 8S1-like n=1 Tax=Desmodus rotundus TaxID=9430 RepID=UPI0023810427|nr:olfactory receptor 8S1-like [Desmodus rotundus]XP_053777971.1 olfactory receptor 8S1-like [Desmodus rotundus]XP_053777976.1 olfactory receptor 8S1-like [Desmodus rotundus]XP_053777977.1 olfactory receptor 8S1-like [Desmodus rotundus]